MAQVLRMLVLLIEENPDIRDVLSEFLLDEGFLVSTARNGKEALDLLACIERPCVILLDVFMPLVEGHQFLNHLSRRYPHLRDVPVVAMVEGEMHRVGGPFIGKPFGLQDIEAALREHCRA